jgi:hypothetical protein
MDKNKCPKMKNPKGFPKIVTKYVFVIGMLPK